MPRANGTTSAKQIEDTERQRRVLALRVKGYSLAQIAEIEGYADASGALKAVKAGIRRACLEPAEELRRIQIARYENIILELWPLVVHDVELAAGQKEAQPFYPNLKALDRLLKAFQQLEAVGGLNVLKVAPTTPDGDNEYKPYKPTANTAADIFNVLASAGIIQPTSSASTDTTAE